MVQSLCKELQFPQEATDVFVRLDDAVMSNPTWKQMFLDAKEDYMAEGEKHLDILRALASELGVADVTIHMILILRLALELRPVYAEKGYSDQLYLDGMMDIYYKLRETRQVGGVWGNGALKWYRPFFQCTRFALGRLQYEVRPWKGPSYEPWIIQGQDAYACHIPSSGPCTPEAVLDSLKRAYEFYKIEGIFVVGCHSWLLYPPHLPLFPENGNMVKFQKNFLIFNQEERENVDLWRIFGVRDVDINLLPEDTTLRRNFKPWLLQGNKVGCGHGVLLFDGEKILSAQE